MTVHDAIAFLDAETPRAWVDQAVGRREELLIDHANCEKKAAGSALNLLYRYVDKPELLTRLAQLAREELLHFEQVLAMMRRLGIDYRHLSPARYASALHARIATHEPERLVDTLLVAAIVEARSCERFDKLAARLDEPLAGFYRRLLASEARHFQVYLDLAEQYARAPIAERLGSLLALDARLATEPDEALRFHSGPLA